MKKAGIELAGLSLRKGRYYATWRLEAFILHSRRKRGLLDSVGSLCRSISGFSHLRGVSYGC